MTEPFTIDRWAEALESGKYAQTKRRLRDTDGYCCLGVALEIGGIEATPAHDVFKFEGHVSFPSLQQLERIGLDNKLAAALAPLNDRGVPFGVIGTFLRTGDPLPLLKAAEENGFDSSVTGPINAYADSKMPVTGTLTGWAFSGDRIYGVMTGHARTELNDKECHTSKVLQIGNDRRGRLIARTLSGSTYLLVDPINIG
jgi:hypothetical protein